MGADPPAKTAAATAAAKTNQEDRATIDQTRIIGNRELPKVLYIVPWKKPGAGDVSGPPTESVLDEALAPIDRDVFRRQVHYDAQERPVTAGQAAGAGVGVTPPAPTGK
ncbi:MAG: hypothetical protein JO133_06635 [Burkholderiaceae bacterium]|nr:hypothetical protein [Burkholderiaceae bacterium]